MKGESREAKGHKITGGRRTVVQEAEDPEPDSDNPAFIWTPVLAKLRIKSNC